MTKKPHGLHTTSRIHGIFITGLATAMGSASLIITVTCAQYALTAVHTPAHQWTLELLLTTITATFAVILGTWLSLWSAVSAIYAAGTALGHQSHWLEQVIVDRGPAFVRRLVTVGIGAALTMTASPALAATDDHSGATASMPNQLTAVTALGWQNSPPPTTQAEGSRPKGSLPVQHSQEAPPQSIVTVQPGDNLWSIAAQGLGPQATAGEIAAAWPQWFELNQEVIGTNPDLIRPGQELRIPPTTH